MKKFEKTKSPRIAKMLYQFKNQNKNTKDKKTYNAKTLNPNQLKNKNNVYNTNTISQSNMSNMTTSQILDYSLINDELKKKRNRGILDVTSHRNTNIFIETDSEQYNSRHNSQDSLKRKAKRCCSKLIVDKVSSQIPNTLSMGRINNNYQSNPNLEKNPNNINDPNSLYNQYSMKTYNNNNLNIKELSELYNLYNSDGYEYEKTETIKIRKFNVNPSGQNINNINNNNTIEEKRIVQNQIKNNRNPNSNSKTIYKYNNIINDNLEENIIKENDLRKEKRTNNLSYISSDMRSRKYPFVIKVKDQDNSNLNQNEFYYRTIRNTNIRRYKESPDNNIINTYIPRNDRSITENLENIVTPSKINNFIYNTKKRIYDNNDINSEINDNNDEQNQYTKIRNIVSKYSDEPKYINDYNNNSVDRNYSNDKKTNNYRTLYIKKEKDYNNLLEEYNDIVVKFNKLKGQYNQIYNDKINNKNKDDDNDGNLDNNNNDIKNKFIEHFSSDLKISENNNISFLNNKKINRYYKKYHNIEKNKSNKKLNILYKLNTNSFNILGDIDSIKDNPKDENENEKRFNDEKLYKENIDPIQLNIEPKKENNIHLKRKIIKKVNIDKIELKNTEQDINDSNNKNNVDNYIDNLKINEIEDFNILPNIIKNKCFNINDLTINTINDININSNKKEINKNNNNTLSRIKKLRDNIRKSNSINKQNEIIPSNIDENYKNNPYEISDNNNFYISSPENDIKMFKDFQTFEKINNSNIGLYPDEMNNNKDKDLKIYYMNQFNIPGLQENINLIIENFIIDIPSTIKSNSDILPNNNNILNIENFDLNISSTSNNNKNTFNEDDLKKENINDINILNDNKKNISFEIDNFNINIQNKKTVTELSKNNETFFNIYPDNINKNANNFNQLEIYSSNNNNFNIFKNNKKNKDNKNIIVNNENITIENQKKIINNNNICNCDSFSIINDDKDNKISINDEINNNKKKDLINSPKKYNHILDEINDYSNELNKNKIYNNKISILQRLKNNGLDINTNTPRSDNKSKKNYGNNSYIFNNSNISSPKNEKGEIIEQNIDRILNQNKILYLDNLVNQKIEKEKEKSKNNNDNNSLLKYYLSKWKNANNDKNKNDKLKNLFRKYAINNWNTDIKDFIDKYENKKPNKKLFNNNINDDDLDDSEGIPDLSYIRNKLHVSIVKRIKITEDEINMYKNCINIISSIIKKHIYRYFLNQYKNHIL